MKGNPCTNHPDKDIKDIEPGTRFCERCRNLVALDWKPIPEIVQEMALEEESEPSVEEVNEEAIIAEHAEVGIKVVHDGDVLRVVEPAKEPVEAEPEEGRDTLEVATEGYVKQQEEARKAEIAALKAKLAELEK